MNSTVFGKTMQSVRKHRDKTCINRTKKKLFNILTKLSYSKIFFKKFISHRNQKKNNNKYS